MNKATVNDVSAHAPGELPSRIDAPELAADIKAIPLVSPDFTNPRPKNPDVAFRWIEFKARDGFRFQQALTQGFAVATSADLANPEMFKTYVRDAGTKYINGDVILMKIQRTRYLGALKHRVERTQALSTRAGVMQGVSKVAAEAELPSAAKVSGKMGVFAPGAEDLRSVGIDAAKIPGIGGTPGVESGTGNDVRAGK